MPESNSNMDPKNLWPDLYEKSRYCLEKDEVIQSLFLATPGASPLSISSLIMSALSYGAPPRTDIVVVTNKSIKILDPPTIPFVGPDSTFGGKILEKLPRNIRLGPIKKSFSLFYKCTMGGKNYWIGRKFIPSIEIADSFLKEG